MLRSSAGSALLWIVTCCPVRADLIAYWNFNTYGGDAPVIPADQGAGTIVLAASWPATDLDHFTGTTLSTLPGDEAGESLSLKNQANNGRHLEIRFSALGYRDVSVSFAARRSGTGFASNHAELLINGRGSGFQQSFTPRDGAYELVTFDLSSAASLNNAGDARLRVVFDGATSASGNNRIDNVQVLATPIVVPEPSAFLLVTLATLSGLAVAARQ
jgi:hypothetical protein